jgi:hypothetical protein
MVGRAALNLWGLPDRPTMNVLMVGWSGHDEPIGGGPTDQPSAVSMVGWSGRDEPMGNGRTDQPSVRERRVGVAEIGGETLRAGDTLGISLNQVP